MAKSLLIELFTTPSERDRQVLAGPSVLGSACNRCVWRALSKTEDSWVQSPYWLGAVIGTAVHLLAETKIKATRPDLVAEPKIVIGELEGYGTIKGSTDCYQSRTLTLFDWKGTKRKDKPSLLAAYANMAPVEGEPGTHKKARLKLRNYVGQLHLYGLGMIKAGGTVEKLRIEFFCRDGVGDDDIIVMEFDYDLDFAQALWNRIEYIWNHMDEEYEAQPHCFPCEMEV